MTIFGVFITLYLFIGGALMVLAAKNDPDGLREAGKDCSIFDWVASCAVWITCWLPLLVWDTHRDK